MYGCSRKLGKVVHRTSLYPGLRHYGTPYIIYQYQNYCTSIRTSLVNDYWIKTKLVVKHRKVENAENKNDSLYLKSPLRDTFWQILGKLFLDEIIIDLFSCAHTGESQKKSRNHDLPKCIPEWRFKIFRRSTLGVNTRFSAARYLRLAVLLWLRRPGHSGLTFPQRFYNPVEVRLRWNDHADINFRVYQPVHLLHPAQSKKQRRLPFRWPRWPSPA